MGLQCISLIESKVVPAEHNDIDIITQYEHGYYHIIVRNIRFDWKVYKLTESVLLGGDKLYFIKLCYNIRNKNPFWTVWSLEDVIRGGYERMFCWMWDHNKDSCISDMRFEELSFDMACVVGNPNLLTKCNVLYHKNEGWRSIRAYSPCDEVINKIVDIGHVTYHDIFIEIGSCYGFVDEDLFTRLINLIRCDAQTMSYDDVDYRQIHEADEYFNSRFIDICRECNLDALDNSWDGGEMSYYYCGIAESNYDAGVIRKLYECCNDAWDYNFLLRRAYKLRDRRMIELVLPCMVEVYNQRR
jgi:hypothetical protein